MVRGVRFRLIYLYLLQVRDAARDAAARFPNIFLHRDIIEMLTNINSAQPSFCIMYPSTQELDLG